jgi:hypothetical protein
MGDDSRKTGIDESIASHIRPDLVTDLVTEPDAGEARFPNQ